MRNHWPDDVVERCIRCGSGVLRETHEIEGEDDRECQFCGMRFIPGLHGRESLPYMAPQPDLRPFKLCRDR